jgi:hypothetical protein
MAKIVDKDKGFKKLLATNKKLVKKPHVKVGVQGSDATENYEDSPLTVVAIANFNEFGLGVPERSFLRSCIDENRAKYINIVTQLKSEIVLGVMDNTKAMSLLGEKIKSDVVKRIEAGIAPENAPSTIEQKGSSTPLIDTGQLRQSITYVVEARE